MCPDSKFPLWEKGTFMSQKPIDLNKDKQTAKNKIETLICFPEVKQKLENGEKISEIALYIQEEAKEYLEVKREAIVRSLYRYQNNSITNEQRDELLPSTALLLKGSLQEYIDPIEALNLLLNIQIDRIAIEYKIEKKLGKTLASTTKAIDIATTIANALNRASSDEQARKLKYGDNKNDSYDAAVKRQHDKITESVAARYGEVTANIMNDPAARRRILNVVEKLGKGTSGPLYDSVRKRIMDMDSNQESKTKK